LEDDDEVWESNIEFAVKPFKGKCTAKTDGAAGGPMRAQTLTTQPCAAPESGTTAEVKKYCDKPAGQAGQQFAVQSASVLVKLKAAYVSSATADKWIYKKSAKYAHYVAKILSMQNKESSSSAVLSFDLKPADGAYAYYQDNAAGGTYAVSADAGYLCYSKASMTWAKNDPVVKNMNGEEFEIMATGIFSLLTIKETEAQTLFEAAATIDRAGTRCGATYIQNITLSGQWVQDIGVPQIEVKAEAAVPKADALQVNFNGEWQSTKSHLSSSAIQKADAKKIVLKLSNLLVTVSVDSHRIHEGGKRTARFANFLNVNFGNMSGMSGLFMGGLLGKDSHEAAVELPEGCESNHQLKSGDEGSEKMFSSIELA